jgi:hypothetical protein
MAAEVRRLLLQWGFAVEDQRLAVEDLLAADHVFLTNSLMGAVPAVSLLDTELGYDTALCDKLNRAVFLGEYPGAGTERLKPPTRAWDKPGSGVRPVVADVANDAAAALHEPTSPAAAAAGMLR